MFKGPENMGAGEQKDFDLDFTKPEALKGVEVHEDHLSLEEKIKETEDTIAGFDRILQNKEYPDDLLKLTEDRKKKVQETLDMLVSMKSDSEKPATQKFEVADMDDALYAFGEKGAADKADRARLANQ